jgi:hypothetical protein
VGVGTVKTYFIQAEDGGPVKIGRGARPENRLKDIQTGNPYRLVLRGVLEGDQEDALHRKFHAWRMSGEWFFVDDELAKIIHDDHGVELVLDTDKSLLDGLRKLSSRWVRMSLSEIAEALHDSKCMSRINYTIKRNQQERADQERKHLEAVEKRRVEKERLERLRVQQEAEAESNRIKDRFRRCGLCRHFDWREPVRSAKWVRMEAARLIQEWKKLPKESKDELHKAGASSCIREARGVLQGSLIRGIPEILSSSDATSFFAIVRHADRVNPDILGAHLSEMKDYKFDYLEAFDPWMHSRVMARYSMIRKIKENSRYEAARRQRWIQAMNEHMFGKKEAVPV